MSEINTEKVKKWMQDNKYTSITISPKEEEWNDTSCSYPFRLNPGEKLPHDNFIKVVYTQSMGDYQRDGSFVKEIKETDTDYLAELFKQSKKENIKRIDADYDWKPFGYHPDNPGMPYSYKFAVKNISNVKMTERERERERNGNQPSKFKKNCQQC